jgi:uncharacterized protein YcfJ
MKLSRILLLAGCVAFGSAPMLAHAADSTNSDSGQKQEKHGAAKGAAIGGVAGHEMGSGHAVAGAAAGAAIGHHEQKKANGE